MRRVAWSGSRDHECLAQVWQAVSESEPHVMVVGGARGVDDVAECAQRQRGGEVDLFPVTDEEWKRIGPRAGHLRNARMAEAGISMCHAFPWGEARGTRDMIEQCQQRGIPVKVHEPGEPSLLIQSARMGYKGRDSLDVTRKSASAMALAFAPTWPLLNTVIDIRKQLASIIKRQKAMPERDRGMLRDDIMNLMAREEIAWREYVPRFIEEMRGTWRTQRGSWQTVLHQPRVVLLCMCVDKVKCHRHLLRGLFVKAGAKIGRRVVDGGDLNYADRS